MFCNHCGKSVADGNRFCPFCGAQLETPPPPAPAGAAVKRSRRGLVLTVLALAVLAAAGAAFVFFSPERRLVRQSVQLMEAGEHEQAAPLLEQALEEDQHSAQAWMLLADTDLLRDDWDAAAAHMDQAAYRCPDDPAVQQRWREMVGGFTRLSDGTPILERFPFGSYGYSDYSFDDELVTGEATVTYHDTGAPASMLFQTGREPRTVFLRTFDPEGRPLTIQWYNGGDEPCEIVTFEYGEEDRITGTRSQHPDGSLIAYSTFGYDLSGNLESIRLLDAADDLLLDCTWEYSAGGQLEGSQFWYRNGDDYSRDYAPSHIVYQSFFADFDQCEVEHDEQDRICAVSYQDFLTEERCTVRDQYDEDGRFTGQICYTDKAPDGFYITRQLAGGTYVLYPCWQAIRPTEELTGPGGTLLRGDVSP